MNKTIRTKKHKIIIAAVSAILCAAILISCFYKENEYFTAVSPGIFSEILEENGENIKVVSHFDIPDYSEKCPSFMTNAAFAYPLTKSKGGSFTPFYVSTAVIACDNSKIKTSPSSWSELFYSTEKVAVLSKDLDFCGASLCYALKSENAAIEFLRRLKREDRLVFI